MARNPFWGTKIISSFFPTISGFRIGFVNFETLGRPGLGSRELIFHLGRRRVLILSKPIRKPANLGKKELKYLVPQKGFRANEIPGPIHGRGGLSQAFQGSRASRAWKPPC